MPEQTTECHQPYKPLIEHAIDRATQYMTLHEQDSSYINTWMKQLHTMSGD